MTDVDHYCALGVAPTATISEIRKAYRAAVKRYHPDVGGDTARFREIQRAWEVLGSEESRALYDAERAAGTAYGQPGSHDGAATQGAGDGGATFDAATAAAAAAADIADQIAARRRHAVAQRARLDTLWSQLESDDVYVGELRRLWHQNLSDSDRAEVRYRHQEALNVAAERFAQAKHLAELLGVAPEAWPDLPNLSALAGPPDELGWEDSHRAWFTEPWDLLTGPLWMHPTPMLRVRAGAWSALVAALFVLARRAGVVGFGFGGTGTTDAVRLWAATVPLSAVTGSAAVLGALAWPAVLAVGLVRRMFARIDSRMARYAVAGAIVAALVAGEWWTVPAAGVIATVLGAAAGAAAAALRPVLARLWVRWWTATVGARLDEWRRRRRSRRGPRATGRRARRRAGLA